MSYEGGRTEPPPKQGDLHVLTRDYALRILRLYGALPEHTEAQVLGKQVLRSGTSVGAQYRVATRSRSPAEFISKMEGALQELEGTAYWLELLGAGKMLPESRLAALRAETNELIAMFVASVKTVKARR